MSKFLKTLLVLLFCLTIVADAAGLLPWWFFVALGGAWVLTYFVSVFMHRRL